MQQNIPLLEFDPDPRAVIMPDHEGLELRLPTRAVFAFLGDTVADYALAHQGEVVGEFESITGRFPVYVLPFRGEQVCLMQAPMGAAAAVQILDWLIGYGAGKILSAGSCGALEDFEENTFLVPVRALRDEGVSWHYQPPARFQTVDSRAVTAIAETLRDRGLGCREVTTWTTDAFFRETPGKVAARKAEGCAVVEMECAAMAACAGFRGAVWGQLLYTADSLAKPEGYDPRDWGRKSRETALELCLDAVMRL